MPMWHPFQIKTVGGGMCCQLCLPLRCPSSGYHLNSLTTLRSQRMGVPWLLLSVILCFYDTIILRCHNVFLNGLFVYAGCLGKSNPNTFSGNVQCWLALSDFPNNSQLCMFFREFAQFGYKSSAEAVVTKFPYCDGSRCLEQFSVGVSDGFTKVLLMFLIVSFVEELELSKEELETLKDALCSFKYVRCTYEHFDNPGHHYLNSLSFLAMFLLREGGTCFSQLIH